MPGRAAGKDVAPRKQPRARPASWRLVPLRGSGTPESPAEAGRGRTRRAAGKVVPGEGRRLLFRVNKSQGTKEISKQ